MNANRRIPRIPQKTIVLWLQDAWATVTLAVPLVLTVLSYIAMVTTDRVMMGWLGPYSLAAGKLSGHLYDVFEFFAIGVLDAVTPILSQQLGARRFRMVRRTFRHGVWVGTIVAIPCIAAIWYTQAILVLLGQDPDLALAGQAYVRYMVVGFLPLLWLLLLSRFLAAHLRPRPMMFVMLIGIVCNALFDYALMFGHFGFPKLGLVGAGIATAGVTILMFLALLTFVLMDRRLRRYRLLGRIMRVDWREIYGIIRIGVPIAVTNLAEIVVFLAATLLMGLIGTTALAAHAIANQCSAIVYAVPYGIAQAATVRVGRATGAGNTSALSRAGWAALGLGAGFAFVPAAVFWFFGDAIVDLFLDADHAENQPTIELAISFLAIVALMQFTDSVGRVALGVLRGLKDTRVPMQISLAGYWGLGLTSAAVFGIYLHMGGEAIWISLAVAVSVVCALLVHRFMKKTHLLISKK